MNDTKTMALLIYTSTVFLIVRGTVYATVNNAHRMVYESVINSLDIIVSILVYMLPKFLNRGEKIDGEILPDLFLNTTIMLADIEGFAAWSSVREPVQVFKFLESLFESFDRIAKRHKVYKVETIGECYSESPLKWAPIQQITRVFSFNSCTCRSARAS